VLIVEDELLIAMFLEGVLEDEGCAIIGPASCVDDALLLLERERIDAAVLDASLDGEAVSSVANALEVRNVPFVFHSGYGPEHLPPRAPGAPPRHKTLLRKPSAPSAIVVALRKALCEAA
jgi:CheY-like chemotaxis protein